MLHKRITPELAVSWRKSTSGMHPLGTHRDDAWSCARWYCENAWMLAVTLLQAPADLTHDPPLPMVVAVAYLAIAKKLLLSTATAFHLVYDRQGMNPYHALLHHPLDEAGVRPPSVTPSLGCPLRQTERVLRREVPMQPGVGRCRAKPAAKAHNSTWSSSSPFSPPPPPPAP